MEEAGFWEGAGSTVRSLPSNTYYWFKDYENEIIGVLFVLFFIGIILFLFLYHE